MRWRDGARERTSVAQVLWLKLSFQILLLAVCIGGDASAQPGRATLFGYVIDAETLQPLVGAHVFVASSTIGTATDGVGRYLLDHVPAGGHSLYVSMLGYAPVRIDTLLRAGRFYHLPVRLEPTILEGPEVVITAERPASWHRRLRKFERLFIGESPNAEGCELTNPEVLTFGATWWGRLSAEAREPLEIVNRALGYRVTYFLEEFESSGGTIRYDGEPLFEELVPTDSAEAASWREKRRQAFLGSFRHFMYSLVRDSVRDAGFSVHRRYDVDRGLDHGDRFRFIRQRVLKEGASPQEKVLDFHGFIEIVYARENPDPSYLRWMYGSTWDRSRVQRSLIKLTDGPTRVDASGEVIDPYGVTVYGHFAFERVADLVPKDYLPDDL